MPEAALYYTKPVYGTKEVSRQLWFKRGFWGFADPIRSLGSQSIAALADTDYIYTIVLASLKAQLPVGFAVPPLRGSSQVHLPETTTPHRPVVRTVALPSDGRLYNLRTSSNARPTSTPFLKFIHGVAVQHTYPSGKANGTW